MKKVVITKVVNESVFRTLYQAIIQILADRFPGDMRLFFGFAWQDPFNNREEPVAHADDILKLVKEAESLRAGTLGQDNLHLYWDGNRNELIFCHESDMHLIFEESSALTASILQLWEKEGLIIYQGDQKEDKRI